MKVLSTEQLIELLPPSAEAITTAAQLFCAQAPLSYLDPQFLSYAVKEGWLEAIQIQLDGVPAYMIFFHITADGGLWVNAGQSLSAKAGIDCYYLSIDRICQMRNCKYTRGVVIRQGMVKTALAKGYKIDGLLMSKRYG